MYTPTTRWTAGDARALARALGERAEAVCRHFLPRGTKSGRYWMVGSVQGWRIPGYAELCIAGSTPVLNAAHMMGTVGNRAARKEIALIKVVAPSMALRAIDRAVQAHGAMGVSGDSVLAAMWAHERTLRLADGPDEVHLESIARLELEPFSNA